MMGVKRAQAAGVSMARPWMAEKGLSFMNGQTYVVFQPCCGLGQTPDPRLWPHWVYPSTLLI